MAGQAWVGRPSTAPRTTALVDRRARRRRLDFARVDGHAEGRWIPPGGIDLARIPGLMEAPARASTVTWGAPLATLVGRLRALGELARHGPDVQALLEEVALPLAPLVAALRFRRGRYTRFRVHHERGFEVLLLAWAAGSAAPPHDHDGQDCWLVPLVGVFDIEDYCVLPRDEGRARLRRTGARRCGIGCCDHRDRDEAVHAVTLAASLGVSLHVYARPLERCRVFDPGRDTWQWRRLDCDGHLRLLAD